MTFGLKPTAPETGFGYIRAGAPLHGMNGVREITAFVEKPDQATAEAYVASGEYLWNSGMFVLPAAGYLAELYKFEPEISRHCGAAVSGAVSDTDFLRLPADAFGAAPAKSIDYAVMERTNKAAVVPADMGWSDIGSWAALHEILPKDPHGNAAAGNVLALDTRGCYLRSDGPLVAAVGVQDLVIVATEDAVLIVPRHESQRVREAVAALKARESSQDS